MAIALGQIPPGHPGGQLPQDPVDHLAVVGPLATRAATFRQQRRDFGPGLIGEHTAADHATSHIKKLAATRTYNTAVRQTLVAGPEWRTWLVPVS